MKKKIESSFEIGEALRVIGENLRIARLRRSEAASGLAQRMGVGRGTIERLERGDGGVSSALLLEVLSYYGFKDQLFSLGDPERDEVGKRMDALRRPVRGRHSVASARTKIDPSAL